MCVCFIVISTVIVKQTCSLKANHSINFVKSKLNGMLKLIPLSKKYNDSIDSCFFPCFYARQWYLCQYWNVTFWLGLGIFFTVQNLAGKVQSLDKHNRELFYKDIKSNAIMVSYDCCIPSIKLLVRSFGLSLSRSPSHFLLKLPSWNVLKHCMHFGGRTSKD